MERRQIEKEVEHIMESGANTMRFVELIERLLSKERNVAVKKALGVASKEAWLTYHCGTTKANTHGHKQINIGADHIKVDHLSVTTLAPQVLKELNNG